MNIMTTKNVWCTLVMLNDNYACGAAVVAQSLRDVGTKYPIWCMVTDDVSIECVEFLATCFDKVLHVPLISYPCVPLKSKKQNEIYQSWIHNSFTKWNILNPDLFPVDKVLFVDADTLFIENCDELFDLTGPAAIFSSPWISPYAQRKINAMNPYGVMGHGEKVNPAHIRAGFSQSVVGLACMVHVIPRKKLYNAMITLLHKGPKYGSSKCISGFDEQLLTEVMLLSNVQLYHIHQRYCCIAGKQNIWLAHDEQAKCITWYNCKPWDIPPETNNWPDDKIWWKVAGDMIIARPEIKKWFYISCAQTNE
jgi:hypothetical protein